ncbi:MAG: hypothetical protein ACLUPV_06325 [Bilophila wadsworthia]
MVPETSIACLARRRHAWNPRQRYWHAETDVWGKTNVCGIRVAGDSAACASRRRHRQRRGRGPRHLPRAGALTLETRDRLAKAALFGCSAATPCSRSWKPSRLLVGPPARRRRQRAAARS